MDPYEALGITPSFDGDLRAVRNTLARRYSEVGSEPDEDRMKAVNLAYEVLRDTHVPVTGRVLFRGRPGDAFELDGQRFVLARRPREPAALAAPLLGVGALALVFGWIGAAVGGAVWVVWRQWARSR